jgi:PAS domain S-box-containing protein
MSAGRPVSIEASAAATADAQLLRREGIRAMLALPLIAGAAWRGYVRIDRCTPTGGWEDKELRDYLEATRLIGWGVEAWLSEVHLRTEMESYRDLVERSPAITYVHTDGEPKRILFMSPRIEEILGYPADAWVREEGFAWTLLHPDDRRRIEVIDALGAPPVLEYHMFARDGREVWWCDASTARWDESGQTLHVGVLVDVTALRVPERVIRDERAAHRSTPLEMVRSTLVDPIPSPWLGPHAVKLATLATEYLREHVADRVDLPSLARALAVSPAYLGRIFKAELGTSPHQFLIGVRLEAARRLLRGTDLTVTQIAWRVGFASVSHFFTTFHMRTGMTPLQFRRRAW